MANQKIVNFLLSNKIAESIDDAMLLMNDFDVDFVNFILSEGNKKKKIEKEIKDFKKNLIKRENPYEPVDFGHSEPHSDERRLAIAKMMAMQGGNMRRIAKERHKKGRDPGMPIK